MKGAEKMRVVTQHAERSANEQAKGGRQITSAIESVGAMVTQLGHAYRSQADGTNKLLASAARMEETARAQDAALRQLANTIASARRG